MPPTPEFAPVGGPLPADPVLERLVQQTGEALGVSIRVVPVAAVTATVADIGTDATRYVEYPIRATTGLVVASVLATAPEPRVWSALERTLVELVAETAAARAAGR